MSTRWVKTLSPDAPVGCSAPAMTWAPDRPTLFQVNPAAKTADLLEFVSLGLYELEEALTDAVGADGMDAHDAWRLKIICQLVRGAQRAVVGEL